MSLSLTISPTKTQFCVFSDKNLIQISNFLNTNNIRIEFIHNNGDISYIPFSHQAKFLGVIFDSRCTWMQHSLYIRQKALSRLNILKAISGIRWGAHPKTLLTVYKGLIRPILDWGCTAMTRMNEASALKLDRIQYAALRISLGLFKSTPTNVILHLNGELPLHLRRMQLINKYIIKACSYENHPLMLRLEHLRNNLPPNMALADVSYIFERLNYWILKTRNHICLQSLPGSLNLEYWVRFHRPSIVKELGSKLSIYKVLENITAEHDYAGLLPTDLDNAETAFRNGIVHLKHSKILYTDASKQLCCVLC